MINPELRPKQNILAVVIVIGVIMISLLGALYFVTPYFKDQSQEFSLLLQAEDYAAAKAAYERVNSKSKPILDELLAQKVEELTLPFTLGPLNSTDEQTIRGLMQFQQIFNNTLKREMETVAEKYNQGNLNYKNILAYNDNLIKYGLDRNSESSFNDSYSNALKLLYEETLKEAQILARNTNFAEAYNKLESIKNRFPYDKGLSNKLNTYKVYQDQQKNLIEYTGPVEHIFVHPLIAYPDRAFKGTMSLGYNQWFITVSEAKKILPALYQNNYILIDLNSLYIEKDGVITARKIMLPNGKKPLILSIDDLNYYEYMIKNGNVFRLILDDAGNVATYSKGIDGNDIIAYDNEIIPLLDQFVTEHPDFSLGGVKGTIALTGYEGVLGYRTNLPDSPTYEQDKAQALKVISRLKETGWNFASHSYGHPDLKSISYDRIVSDTTKWKQEVEPLVGPTKIYIYPYGSSVSDQKWTYLYNSGFRVFCAVGPKGYLKYTNNAVLQDRRHVDGISLILQRNMNLDLYDSNSIIDPMRTKQI